MPTFVALLRGINVGKAKRVPMADLRGLFAELGFGCARTVLNSGNVVFEHALESPAAHAELITEALFVRFGFAVPTVVKTADDLEQISTQNPFLAEVADPSRLLVIFAQGIASPPALRALVDVVKAPDRFALGEGAAYLYCPNGILASAAAECALRGLGVTLTTRNWATVLKLLALIRMGKA